MWEPPESWRGLPGTGPSSRGVWMVPGSTPLVAKRIDRPEAGAESRVWDLEHHSYWRREVDAASSAAFAESPGLRAPRVLDLHEDDDGFVLFTEYVSPHTAPPERVAQALGAFNALAAEDQPWACRELQRQRLDARVRRGSWRYLARTQWSDLADVVWRRQEVLVSSLAPMASGRAHGDLTPGNVLADAGEHLVVADWATSGSAALGEDVGYYWLSVPPMGLESLVDAYVAGLVRSGRDFGVPPAAVRRDVLRAARIVSVLTGFARADWALSRVALGEGPLAAKLSHPSVSRYLRALERLSGHAEALVELR